MVDKYGYKIYNTFKVMSVDKRPAYKGGSIRTRGCIII